MTGSAGANFGRSWARYEVERDRWNDGRLAIYHNPRPRQINVPRMIEAAKRRRSTIYPRIRPYQHRHAAPSRSSMLWRLFAKSLRAATLLERSAFSSTIAIHEDID